MRHIIVTQAFKFAHGGCHVEEFEASDEPRETTDECAEVALAEGWATAAGEPGAPEVLAHAASPETRDAARQRQTKAARPAPTQAE